MDPAVKKYFAKITSEGGKARAKKLSPKRRKEIAQQAAAARWAKERQRKKAEK